MQYLSLGFLLMGVIMQATCDVFSGQQCGQRKATFKNTFVIGGEDARHGDWPWQVLLLKSNNGPSFCGGSLINNQWVVTAAHCVTPYARGPTINPQGIDIRLGETDRTKREESEITIRAGEILYHSGYSKAVNNDIALIKLSRPVTFTNYIQPICVAAKEAPVGSSCYITGWGKMKSPGRMVNKLQQGLLHKQSRKGCAIYNSKMRIKVTEQMICGAQPGTRVSGCHGDSGGPYVCKIGSNWELHGAVSWGSSRCDSKAAFTVFANIAYFKGWIEKNVSGRNVDVISSGERCTDKSRWCAKKYCKHSWGKRNCCITCG